MKTGKLFTIDVEIAEKLKNVNASQLVNELLREYFEHRIGKNSLREQKEAILKDISKKKSRFRKKFGLSLSGIPSSSTDLPGSGYLLANESPRTMKSLLTSLVENIRKILSSSKRVSSSTKNTEKCSNDVTTK